MEHEGPALEHLLHRLTEVPPEFLSEPKIAGKGEIHVPAVVRDLLAAKAALFDTKELEMFSGQDAKADRNRLSIALLMTWLLADDQLPVHSGALALKMLREDAQQLAAYTTAAKLVADAERREELVRLTLARMGLRPKGESVAQAQDRFTSISSLERARILKATQEEDRAREVRKALARKAAEEAADKWTRE